jgi:hypothetical protein
MRTRPLTEITEPSNPLHQLRPRQKRWRQGPWHFAGIPLLPVSFSSCFTVIEARERGEVFGGLLALHVTGYAETLNAYAKENFRWLWLRKRPFGRRGLMIC